MKLFDLLGPDGPEIRKIFERMDIAEEEITEMSRLHPEEQVRIWNSFKLLTPTEPLRELSHDVYRAHCKELLRRVVKNEDTRPATNCEVIGAISRVSTMAPPCGDLAYLMHKLMICEFGYEPDVELFESYKGASDEIHVKMRHKLAVKDRVPKRVEPQKKLVEIEA